MASEETGLPASAPVGVGAADVQAAAAAYAEAVPEAEGDGQAINVEITDDVGGADQT